jgi:hypothetical protein
MKNKDGYYYYMMFESPCVVRNPIKNGEWEYIPSTYTGPFPGNSKESKDDRFSLFGFSKDWGTDCAIATSLFLHPY